MKSSVFSSLLLLIGFTSFSQTTNISGVINSYAAVLDISEDTLEVNSSVAFTLGDKILLMQMQGAAIDQSNSAAYGDIVSLNGTGNYEYTEICEITGNKLIVTDLERNYSPLAVIQVIHVPVYEHANISGLLTAAPWNGTTGGVLVFECRGNLSMNAGIDVSALGFRGGAIVNSNYNCTWLSLREDYSYDITTGYGAKKGEGIAAYISGQTGGRGAQANGGGGSNDHNGGGGGGANASAGGQGGERIKPSAFTCGGAYPGVGGKANTYSNSLNQVFLGGGGGAGHEDNPNTGTAGGNGGGIVMIKADTLFGNSDTIQSFGASVLGNAADGAGGGGAGGSVLLEIENYSGVLHIELQGGDGGNVSNIGLNCNGPGGGGGGGLLWVNQAVAPSNISLSISGGLPGKTLSTGQGNCTLNGSNFAAAGMSGLILPELSLYTSQCDTTINSAESDICLGDSIFAQGSWKFTSGIYRDTLFNGCCPSILETEVNVRALDTSIYVNFPSLTSNALGVKYQWFDCVSQEILIGDSLQSFTAQSSGNFSLIVTKNGCSDTSRCFELTGVRILENSSRTTSRLFPNPTEGRLSISFADNDDELHLSLFNLSGKLLQTQTHKGLQHLNLQIYQPAGVYIVRLEFLDRIESHRITLFD